jgi:hypothetical protein
MLCYKFYFHYVVFVLKYVYTDIFYYHSQRKDFRFFSCIDISATIDVGAVVDMVEAMNEISIKLHLIESPRIT